MLGLASSSFAPSWKEGEPGMLRLPAFARKCLSDLAALSSTICRCCSLGALPLMPAPLSAPDALRCLPCLLCHLLLLRLHRLLRLQIAFRERPVLRRVLRRGLPGHHLRLPRIGGPVEGVSKKAAVGERPRRVQLLVQLPLGFGEGAGVLVEDEYDRSFADAQRQAHEELNTARALAHSRLLDDAFRRAAKA